LEVGVDKSRNLLSDRVMGRDNGAVRVIGFMEFREEVEGRDSGIGNMEKGDILGRETIDGASVLKESERAWL
jgi:hypothetical protein